METEAKRYTIWEKKKKKKNNNDKILIKTSSYDDSWEEQAFAEDAAGNLGGCVWPPRSYSCSFCKREFRSAQALGGHMNVHRRDRARLKHESLQSHIENPEKNNPFKPLADVHHPSDQICDLVFSPNPNPKSSSSWFSQNFEESDYRAKRNHDFIEVTHTDTHSPIIFHKWYQSTDLSSQKHQTSNSIDDSDNGNGNDDLVCRKRKRTDASSIAFLLRSSTVSDHYVKPEVIGLSPSSNDELDLELRLGDGRPKPKPKPKLK